MKESRWFSVERSIDQDLPYGRGEKVRSADNFCDAHCQIVDDYSELVSRYVISIPDKEIPEIAQGRAGDCTEISILKRDRFSVWHTKSPVRPLWLQALPPLFWRRSPLNRKDGIFRVRSEGRAGHISS
jgi:hypothetical protein